MNLNERVAAITPSITLGITSQAKAMVAAGETVHTFAAGEPDFDTPEHIKAEAAKRLAEGETKYAPVPGLPALRKAISEKLANENGLTYAPEQIVVSNGGKHSLYNIMMALCREGDEVVIPSPYWLSYPEMVGVAGGKPVCVATGEDNGFKITPADLEAACTDATVAVIINSPSNPTGSAYTKDELASLGEVALKHGLYIISDEIYEKITYDGFEHVSIGSLSKDLLDHTITCNGLSKAYSMTGWRLGYCAGPLPLMKAISALQSHSTSGVNTFAQYGALAALTGPQECVSEMCKAFAERGARLHERLTAIDGVTCLKPQGAFYMFPNISSYGLGSVEFCERLLKEQKVAAVPGAAFGADANIRLSYACSMDTIEKGIDALEAFLASL
jgi:aspartate aminotransferase